MFYRLKKITNKATKTAGYVTLGVAITGMMYLCFINQAFNLHGSNNEK